MRRRRLHLAHHYDLLLYRQRIQEMFAKLKHWWRIHTNYGRCADLFPAGIIFAALFLFWIDEFRP